MPWKNLKVQGIKTLAPENREVSKAWFRHIKKKVILRFFY